MPTAFVPIVRFCTTCRGDTAFEQPDCIDGHGVECPEWVCIECGDAVLVGFARPAAGLASRPTSHVA